MNQRSKRNSVRLLGLLLVSVTPLTAQAVENCDSAATYWTSCMAGCPDAAAFCAAVHHDPANKPSSNTGYCSGQACFMGQTGVVKYGFLNPVVADGAVGQFPTKWNVTISQAAQLTFANCDVREVPGYQTVAKDAKLKKGTKLEITVTTRPNEAEPRCYFDLVPLQGSQLTDVVYHEHIAAFKSTRCLGWLECSHSTSPAPQASDQPSHR